ncbi:MAG: hypothetical protein Q8M65_08900 [Rhodoglobus sp.]|nr:hypothetical protein [Rhodoglobus sp.]
MSQLTFRASVALVIALLCTLIAAPAVAAGPVPDGGGLYGVSCDWSRSSERLAVTRLDTDSASAHSVGFTDESFEYFCAYSSSWDQVTASCVSYTVAREPDDVRALVRTDLTSGTSTFVGRFLVGQGNLTMSSVAVDTGGNAWGLARDALYSVNLADATSTLVTTFAGNWMMGLTLNPADGLLYTHDDVTIYRIDPVAQTITAVVSVPAASGGALDQIVGMAIDAGGAFWFSQVENVAADPSDWTYALWHASAFLTDFERVGRIADRVGPVGVFALMAVPQAACPDLPTLALPDPPTTPAGQLAATGGEVSGATLAAAVLGLAIGAVLLRSSRRRHSRRH